MSTTLDQFDITGRSAFIAGTASGIGLAYAEAMAEAGAKVTLSDIDVEEAEREAARLCSEGGEVRAAKVNVSDLDQVAAACDDHVSSYGGWTLFLPMRDITQAMASGTPAADEIRKDRLMFMILPPGADQLRSN